MVVPGWLVLNTYSLILIIMLLFFSLQKGVQRTEENRRFVQLLSMAGLLMTVSSVCKIPRLFLGDTLTAMKWEWAGNFFVFSFDPVWFLFAKRYIECWIADPGRGGMVLDRFLKFYAVLNVVAVFVSSFLNNHWFFYYEDYTYHRGTLFMSRGVINMSCCVMVAIYVILSRRRITRVYRRTICAFPLIVLGFGMLQVVLPGLEMEYTGTILACLLLYIFVQSRNLNVDYLTGTFNRRGLDAVMETRIKESEPGFTFSAFMFDLDRFKSINDDLGHSTGDEALQNAARILSSCFRGKEDIVGRYGGDEFVVITGIQEEEKLEEAVGRLRVKEKSFNSEGRFDYQVLFSVGYAVYDPETGMDAKEFRDMLDTRMYENKKKRKSGLPAE